MRKFLYGRNISGQQILLKLVRIDYFGISEIEKTFQGRLPIRWENNSDGISFLREIYV